MSEQDTPVTPAEPTLAPGPEAPSSPEQLPAEQRALVMETANRVALDILSNRTGVAALRHIVEAARVLSGARYGALGVTDHVVSETGKPQLIEFITVGLSPAEEARIGPRPRGAGVLGLLLERAAPLRLDSIAAHPASVGFPPNHPPMNAFLGVPIRRGEETLGSLYLTDKSDGESFTLADELAVAALGAHAAVAIHHLHMQERQRALTARLIMAQEEERRAVAYEVHDGLTQYVMGAHAHLESFRRAHEGGDAPRAGRELERGMGYLRDAAVEARRLINGLRPLALDDLGLAGALEQLVREEQERAGWNSAEYEETLGGKRFDVSVETGLYRIAQEALTNARRHAQTERVCVNLTLDGAGLTLEVRDWGHGFDAKLRGEQRSGESVGMHGMAERASLLGGTLDIVSVPRDKGGSNSGTRVRVVVPSPPEARSAQAAGSTVEFDRTPGERNRL